MVSILDDIDQPNDDVGPILDDIDINSIERRHGTIWSGLKKPLKIFNSLFSPFKRHNKW